ncbi:MAG: zinc ribbon domain-containing protein, partial [Clostridiales bacterium]|nr:zinc ribbon domain-containing protein [Clostridiales bacterium]
MSFLDGVFSKAKDVTKAAGKKTDNLVKISKLKMQCATINSNIRSTYEKLGNIVYDMIKSDNENQTVLLGVVSEIDDLYKQLERTTKKLEKLKKIYSCPRCDEKNKSTAVYCSKCGQRLVVTDSYEDSDTYVDIDIKG